MRAEIIGVGTELLLGQTINSDAALVARELAALGINVFHAQMVGDNAERLERALREALARSDIVITTGGLGPTNDDLTRDAVARAAGLPLERDAQSARQLAEYFGDRPMGENQQRQAMFPKGAVVFPNSCGTAPGCAVTLAGDKSIIMLPGPPDELLPMLENEARPYLARLTGNTLHSEMIHVFGIGEGRVAEILGPLLDGENPTAATYAGGGELVVRVTARARTEAAARELARPLAEEISAKLGPAVYGVGVPSLEHVVVRELANQRATIATAESCTGGLLARRITDVPGSSSVFEMGLVTYANRVKSLLLDIPEDMLERYGAVSPEVAALMAENVRRLANATFGVGISGIAGPAGGSPEKPVGLVYICVSHRGATWMRVMRPHGRYPGRERVRRRAASHALDMVRRILASLPLAVEWV